MASKQVDNLKDARGRLIIPKILYDMAKDVYGPDFVEREYALQPKGKKLEH